MAAGKFFMFLKGWRSIVAGDINLESDTIKAIPLHNGYTPGTATHSALAQMTNFQSTASGTVVAALTLSGIAITVTGENAVKLTFPDLAGFSAGGDTFQQRYLGVYAESASRAGTDNLLIGFFDLDSGGDTGVEGTQVNVTWPSRVYVSNVNTP